MLSTLTLALGFQPSFGNQLIYQTAIRTDKLSNCSLRAQKRLSLTLNMQSLFIHSDSQHLTALQPHRLPVRSRNDNPAIFAYLCRLNRHMTPLTKYDIVATTRHSHQAYSHSIVPGGFDVMSYTTRLIPRTSLTIRLEIVRSTSYGSGAQSAVMPSSLSTARIAQVFA